MRIAEAIHEIGVLDRLAVLESPIHRIDPRAKVAVTAAFILTVVSFPKYEIAELTLLGAYPLTLAVIGRVPIKVFLRYLLLASPFAILVGIFNPLLDRGIVFHWGTVAVSAGWFSFISILIRFLLTVSASLILLACTGYTSVCSALGRMGIPRLIVMQFLLIYRFVFILSDEAARMARAHALRSQSGRASPVKIWSSLAGNLLLRAYDRGVRLHQAMLSRGFAGQFRSLRFFRWSRSDSLFLTGCLGFLIVARFGRPVERLGIWILELFR